MNARMRPLALLTLIAVCLPSFTLSVSISQNLALLPSSDVNATSRSQGGVSFLSQSSNLAHGHVAASIVSQGTREALGIFVFIAYASFLVALIVYVWKSEPEPGKSQPEPGTSDTNEESPQLTPRVEQRSSMVGVPAWEAGSLSVAAVELDSMDMELWDTMADSGELDLYTCLSLCIGLNGLFDARTRRYWPSLLILLTMQLVLPVCLVCYQVKHVTYYTDNQSVLYRFIGFILFLYSIRSMYEGALDECRSWLIDVMLDCGASGWYIWPMFIGEFVNAFVGLVMTLTTFLIFCDVRKVEELLLNCVAVAFITEIDGELVSKWMKDTARADLITSTEIWIADVKALKSDACRDFQDGNEPASPTSPTPRFLRAWKYTQHASRRVSRVTMKALCKAIRIVGTVGTGLSLALVFSLARLDSACDQEPLHLRNLPLWGHLLCGEWLH